MTEKAKTIEQKQNETWDNLQTKFEAYTGNEPYLFVSYSHKDTAAVYPILDALYDRKYRIWYDESCENGNDFRDELRHRIEKAEAVLLFVSKSSMTSPFCGMEIIVARENNKRLYPIYLDDVDVPPAFAILLSNTHHSMADNMDKLIKALVRDLPAVAMDRLTIGDGELKKCEDNGRSITVDEGVRIICADAFKDRKALHTIILPQTLETIGEESFRGCSNLEAMDVPEKTSRICSSAFRDCISMKSLKVRNGYIGGVSFVFVSRGSDEENVSDAVTVRMLSERYGYHPRIWVVTGEKVAAEKVAKGMLCNHRKQGYDISFIGDIESAYSRDAVLFSELEKVALARHMKWGAEEEFWRIEYCYRSSIASAIHKKYKLYCGVPGAEKEPCDRNEEERQLLRRLEHKRWNAYMRSEGYVYNETRNDLAKAHNCLKPFSELPEKEQMKDDD